MTPVVPQKVSYGHGLSRGVLGEGIAKAHGGEQISFPNKGQFRRTSADR